MFKMLRFVIVSCLLILALEGAVISRAKKPIRKLAPLFPNGRIVGGSPTSIEDVPYLVAIEFYGFQICGGSKINSNHILTAAPCLAGFHAPDITVRFGSSKHETGGTLARSGRLNLHPKFDPDTLDYDVAVILLAEDIPDSEISQSVALTDMEPEGGTEVVIAGWGEIEEQGVTPDDLQSVTIPIVDRAICEDSYEDINPITSRMICGGDTGKARCEGDDGGPVVAGTGSNRTQVGIISWGLGCGRRGYFDVYTNVANTEIRDWIRKQSGV